MTRKQKILLDPFDLLRNLAKDFFEFVRLAWPVVEPQTQFVDGWHIHAICEHLEAVTRGDIRNLAICIPPRHMKSLLVSVFWHPWTWTQNPGERFMFSSYGDSLSLRDAVRARQLIQSSWYQKLWGQAFLLTGDQNVKEYYVNNKGGYRDSTSVGGSGTGKGGDTLVIDDPHNIKHAESDARRYEVTNWYDTVWSTRLNNPQTGKKVIIMQRCHAADLIGHLQEKGQRYEMLVLPAEFEPRSRCVTGIGWQDPRTEEKELLWPDRFGRKEVDELKTTLGSYAASAQLQQRPSPLEGGIFKRHWWKFYDSPPKTFDQVIQSWDMAFKDLKSSDYVVGQVWGRVKADKYLLDQVRERLSFTGTLEAVTRMSERWPQSQAKYVEDKANGTAVLDVLRRQISGLIAVEPEGSKVSRAFAVSPQCEAGNVYLPRPDAHAWVWDFIEELAQFPTAAYDDQVDATTQALVKLASAESRYTNTAPLISMSRESYWAIPKGA